ncbi:two-component system response regulator BaeR [Psychromonas sp. B3M02]|uniref:response regulator n=1 Tax=Psychromonas sp. B3M02 TaxID=2267226 RepID=UPI000DE8FB3B|nr:response regulator [Psychromonas sp. B3M02]RBW41554.1 two-component system response regulator BaeR [Psychromonas sp. B3M02]
MANSILIVEDEIKLANLLADYFKLTDYEPHLIDHGDLVIDWVKTHQPSVILLDLMLPGTDGITLCKAIRAFSDVPILMVTAKVDEIDRLLGLELGADDYICKPFSPREVVARVNTVMRRVKNSHSVTSPGFSLDENRLVAIFNGTESSLTSVEFQLLKRLANKPSRIFTREQLMQNMYSDDRIVNNRTIDSHIKKLRKKLIDISQGEDLIQSVYGAGYRLVLPEQL